MKSLYTLVFVFFFLIPTKADKKIAFLLKLEGKSFVINNSTQKELKLPHFFELNDSIYVEKGMLEIMFENGSTTSLKTGQSFKIQKPKKKALFNINALFLHTGKESFFYQASSSNSYTVRSKNEAINAFPNSSKLADINNAILLIKTDCPDYSVEVFNMQNDSLVWSKSNLQAKQINLTTIPMKKGSDYVWIIKAKDQEQMGIISYLEEKNTPSLPLENKADYIKAFTHCLKNEYAFRALNIMKQASSKYPNTDLFKYYTNQ